MRDPSARKGPRPLDVLLYLAGVAGMAASTTLLFLGMRAVMDVGGYCAEGGAYVIAQHCPEGAPLATLLGFLGGFSSPVVVAWKGSAIGGGWGNVAFLAWPAAFGSLGYNFLEYGFNPPGDDPGWAWGWLFCGVIFEAMALVPLGLGLVALWTGLRGGSHSGSAAPPARNRLRSAGSTASGPLDAAMMATPGIDGAADLTAGVRAAGAAFLPDAAGGRPDAHGGTGPGGASGLAAGAAAGADALVGDLERLASLHERGLLTDDEFARAKAELLEVEA